MGKIKVLHVLGTLNSGGAELRTLEIIEKSDKKKFEFHIYTISTEKGNLEDRIRELGIEIHRVKKNSNFKRSFKEMLHENKFDVVHSHLYYYSGMIMYYASSSNVPIRVSHFRTTFTRIKKSFKNKIKYSVLKILVKRYSTNIIGVSNSVLNSNFGINWQEDKKITLIYNGFDDNISSIYSDEKELLKKWGINSGKELYVHVGSFSEAKNHKKLLGIFKEISNRNRNAHLLLVGSGTSQQEQKVENYIKEYHINNDVTLTGQVKNVSQMLTMADIMIFPSLWEGLPGAVIEASIAKKPVLASDIEPCEEIQSIFPNVYTYSLERTNSEWAKKTEKILETHKNNDVAFKEVKDTPFYINNTIKQLKKIWIGS